MFKNRLDLRKVATIIACLAVCVVMSCGGGNDKEKDGNDAANGEVEYKGKKYPIHEGSVFISTVEGGSAYVLNFKSKNGNTTAIVQFNASAGSELPVGTYTTILGNPQFSVDGDAGQFVFLFAQPAKLEVKKSGTDYDITFTCKIQDGAFDSDPKYDYKLTYKGKITTTKL